MIIISAMSANRVIGSGTGMPWNVPDEYAQYQCFVSGQTVIMGRKSFEIFGADLPAGTTVIVVTRSGSIPEVRTASSLDRALSLANDIDGTVFVAGGGTIYKQALPLADEMYLSTIKGDFDGDTYFPEFESTDWKIAEERDETRFIFRRLVRKLPRNS